MEYTDAQFYKLCSAEMTGPIPLGVADPSPPFVYDRIHGLFYVPSGYHQMAMALLLAFHHGCPDGIAVLEKLGLRSCADAADHWIEHLPGACFRSSVSSHTVKAGRPGNLNATELRLFSPVEYLFNEPIRSRQP